jgi:hypothetical protein
MTLETAGAYTHLHVRSTEYSARILFNPQTTDLTFSLLSTSFCDRSDTWRPSSLVSSDRMVLRTPYLESFRSTEYSYYLSTNLVGFLWVSNNPRQA